MIFFGDNKELIFVLKKPRGRLYSVCCFGRRKHYRADHTDETIANAKPEKQHLLRVEGWGGKPPA